jgi:aspartate aminotransferase
MQISQRIAALEESATLQVAALCQQLRAEGIDVIGLSVGEPDFPAPAHVKQAAIDAINNDISHYGPTPGFPALRQAIADTINKDLKDYPVKPYNPNEIVVSVGAKQALCNAIEALIGPGDEVIMPTPCWVSYVEMVKIAQGKSVLIKTTMDNNFCLTPEQLEEAITPNTKLLMLCSPNNPTGSVYTLENLKALVEVLKKYPHVIVLADEIYQHILYTGKHETLAQFPELEDRLIIINGVSKAYAMTGYRIGWLASHSKELITAVKRLQGQTISCATTIAQKAAEAAYAGPQDCVEEMRKAFERRRNLIVQLAKDIPGMKVLEPQGAFYLFPDVSDFFGKQYNGQCINNADDLVTFLLQEAHVALVSGTAFGEDNCIRFSYATSENLIIEAMRRTKEALAKLV